MIIVKIIVWIVIFLYTVLTVKSIKWAIDEYKLNKKVKPLYEKCNIEVDNVGLNLALTFIFFDCILILEGIVFFC